MEKLLEKFPELREAFAKSEGARFRKCALQVNPYSYASNYQGEPFANEDAYNTQMAAICKELGIEVVGIADHGNVDATGKLQEALQNTGIAVFPGFEIASSEKIHMVCLYSPETTVDKLRGYLGSLMGDTHNPSKPTEPSSLTCIEIAKKILGQGGVWYAAHLTSTSGLLRLSGSGDNCVQIWKTEELVRAGQIPGSLSDLFGAGNSQKYLDILENRNPDYKRERPIAVLNAKDVAKPEDLEILHLPL